MQHGPLDQMDLVLVTVEHRLEAPTVVPVRGEVGEAHDHRAEGVRHGRRPQDVAQRHRAQVGHLQERAAEGPAAEGAQHRVAHALVHHGGAGHVPRAAHLPQQLVVAQVAAGHGRGPRGKRRDGVQAYI